MEKMLSFVLLSELAYPNSEGVVDMARNYDMGLTFTTKHDDALCQEYAIDGGGRLMVSLIPHPDPEVSNMPVGIASLLPEELAENVGTYAITIFERDVSGNKADVEMVLLTSAVMANSPAIAAKLDRGAVFHKAAFFRMATTMAEFGIPVDVTVDISMAPDVPGFWTYLTHGLTYYGHEELFITVATDDREASIADMRALIRRIIKDPTKRFLNGETIPRNEMQNVVVERAPGPVGDDQVIHIDFTCGAAAESIKKKRLFPSITLPTGPPAWE